ncbi:unnamed protein product, partial [Adineta steineri]
TKKNPYPKEALLYNSIIGVTCTPYKDGFICIQTKETHDDRGDWLVLVDHPCEFITQLFMIMKRDHNNDGFLKIKTEFTHCRRFYGELSSSLCMVEAHIADAFRIKKLDFETVAIVSSVGKNKKKAAAATDFENLKKEVTIEEHKLTLDELVERFQTNIEQGLTTQKAAELL